MRLPSRLMRGLSLALVGFWTIVYFALAAAQPPTGASGLDVENSITSETGPSSQPVKPVPTRRVDPQLGLGEIECEDQHIQVHFVVVRLPERVGDYGVVEYVVNDQPHRAAFVRRTGHTAHYIGQLPPQLGRYHVSAGRVKIDDLVLTLSNPHTVNVEKCDDDTDPPRTPEPTRTPRPTETAGPTRTPRPTETAGPTRTPRTPEPTRTPRPTLSPRDMALILEEIECEDGEVQVHFVVIHIPDNITADQLAQTKVNYSLKHMLDGAPTTTERQAMFRKLDDNEALYVDVLPGANGIYLVTAASVVIGDKTLTLHNPHVLYGVRECRPEPTRMPTRTREPEVTRTPGPTRTPTATRTRESEFTRTPGPTRTPTATRTPNGPSGAVLAEASKTAVGVRDGEKARVRGQICVTNAGNETTEDLKIVDQVQYRVGDGEFRDLEDAKLTLEPDDIAPRSRRCVEYSIEFAPVPGAMYRNTAQITIENHVGHMDEEFGPTVRESFALP